MVAALLIEAALSGVRDGLTLPQSSDFDGFAERAGERLPQSLGEALETAASSEWLRSVLPEKMLEQYLTQKRAEFEAYQAAGDPYRYEIEQYFDRI